MFVCGFFFSWKILTWLYVPDISDCKDTLAYGSYILKITCYSHVLFIIYSGISRKKNESLYRQYSSPNVRNSSAFSTIQVIRYYKAIQSHFLCFRKYFPRHLQFFVIVFVFHIFIVSCYSIMIVKSVFDFDVENHYRGYRNEELSTFI